VTFRAGAARGPIDAFLSLFFRGLRALGGGVGFPDGSVYSPMVRPLQDLFTPSRRPVIGSRRFLFLSRDCLTLRGEGPFSFAHLFDLESMRCTFPLGPSIIGSPFSADCFCEVRSEFILSMYLTPYRQVSFSTEPQRPPLTWDGHSPSLSTLFLIERVGFSLIVKASAPCYVALSSPL